MLAPDAWLGGPGWLGGLGWPTGPGWLAGPGWPGICGEMLAGPGMAPCAAPVTELTPDPTAETAGPTGTSTVRALVVAGEEPVGGAETGFWAAAARRAKSTAKTSAAADAPHAYRQTLRARSKAREGVADPSTRNKLPRAADNHAYLVSCRTKPGQLPDLHAGLRPA